MVVSFLIWGTAMSIKRQTLKERFPDVAEQWHKEKNGSVTPDTVSPYCNTPYLWICSKGHIWKRSPKSRVNTTNHKPHGCPYCDNKLVWPGFNDLATKAPQIAAEWDYACNMDTPQDVTYAVPKVRSFICPKCGNSYKARISDRTLKGTGCNICTKGGNKKILPGYNDLATKYPCIARYWDAQRNGKTASEIAPNTHDKYYWTDGETSWTDSPNRFVQNYRMLEGHPDALKIALRFSKKEHLLSYRGVSFPEKIVFFYVQKAFSDAVENKELANGTELDIFIPSLALGIEYDGKAFHTKSKIHRDIEKDAITKAK